MTVDKIMDDLRKYIAQDLDVILIGGLRGDILSDDVIDLILDKVRAGTGLVWANPNNMPDRLWEALPLRGLEAGSRPLAQWRAEQSHWLTAGIPWEALRRSRTAERAMIPARPSQRPSLAAHTARCPPAECARHTTGCGRSGSAHTACSPRRSESPVPGQPPPG